MCRSRTIAFAFLLLVFPYRVCVAQTVDASSKSSYAALAVLEQQASETNDVAALSRLALLKETYGDRAEAAYVQLANAKGMSEPAKLNALQRGFNVSLRDGKLKQAENFAAALGTKGHPEYRALLGQDRPLQNDTMVPGGLDALAFIARIQTLSPERFFAEYAKQVVANACSNCMGNEFTNRIQSYFSTLAQLEALGKRDGNRVTITLSVNGKDDRRHTDDVLHLLGVQLHTEKGQLRIERGEKSGQAKKQDILGALAIDEVGLQDALGAGKPFDLEIHDELAAIYPSAKQWKEAFPRMQQGQFALMLLHEPLMVRLYAGISTLDRPTLAALLGNNGLFWFIGRSADLLSLYGTAFAVRGTHAAVPGGVAAEAVWTQMVGANPDHAGQFFSALLQTQTPALLTYFYTLSHLDAQHQAFFTANLVRFKRFYTVFAALPEAQVTFGGMTRASSFTDFLTAVPLDEKGEIDFPGSPAVWTVAKGHDTDTKHIADMMRKVSRAATPDVEDEILLRLADTRDRTAKGKASELDNFLAVSRIDAHRTKPLDEESALLLAQHYSEFAPVYPYFTDLSAITTEGFHSFFNLVDHIRQQSPLEQNLALGQMYSLIEWVVLMERRHAIDDAEAAHLFSLICGRLAAADSEGARAMSTLDLARTILASCGKNDPSALDAAVRTCLLGPAADGQRGKDYDVVLDDQKAPSLNVLALIAKSISLTTIAVIPKSAVLPSVSIATESKASGKEKDALLRYSPVDLQRLMDEWNRNAAKPVPDAKAARKLSEELLKALEPQMTAAIAAPVYGYYMRSTDLIIEEDPLLLRKHRYVDFVSSGDTHALIQNAEFVQVRDGIGSYMEGGFAQFGLAAGFGASVGWKHSGVTSNAVVAEQIAALRSATWERLGESDQRLAALRILAAREWIVQSAQDPNAFVALSDETSGLLSLSRRSSLLNGIEERDWKAVWGSITLPDQFRLGGSYLKHFPSSTADTPVAAQLRAMSVVDDGERLNALGGIPNHVLGCSHPHIIAEAPYEEYERRFLGNDMAERTAELSLFLAYRADSIAVQPAYWSPVAEKLAQQAFRAAQMTSQNDWRAVIAAYGSVTGANLQNAMEP